MVKCFLCVKSWYHFSFNLVVLWFSMSHAFRYRVSISYKPLNATIIYVVHHFFNVCCHGRVFYSWCRFCAGFTKHRAVALKSTSWVHIPTVLWMTEPYVCVRSLLHRRLQSMVRHNLAYLQTTVMLLCFVTLSALVTNLIHCFFNKVWTWLS